MGTWRQKQDFLLTALEEGLMRARLQLLLDKNEKALEEVDFCLKLIEIMGKMADVPRDLSVFNMKTLGARRNAMIVTNVEIMRQAYAVLEKYASLELGRKKLLIDFWDRRNLALKRLFLEVLAEKTGAECEAGRSRFSLNFKSARQMELWNDL